MKKIYWAAVILPLSLALLWLLLPTATAGQAAEVSRETVVATSSPVVVSTQPKRHIYPQTASTTLSASQQSIKEAVIAAFPDVPQMIAVVRCESRFRQFSGTSTPLLSPTADVGVMQINQVHWAEAKALGLDIFNSVADNIAMGRIVYEMQGLAAWTCKA